MSAVTGPMSEPFAAADIAQARSAARAARRRTVDVLEESLALEADGFTARLAATLQLECLTMAELRRAAPAFDLLPFAECSQHSCALLRAADGRLLLAFDDPFSGELQAWAEEHKVRVLNVAGPRESKCPGIYAQAAQFLRAIFSP